MTDINPYFRSEQEWFDVVHSKYDEPDNPCPLCDCDMEPLDVNEHGQTVYYCNICDHTVEDVPPGTVTKKELDYWQSVVDEAERELRLLKRRHRSQGHVVEKSEFGGAYCVICGDRVGWWCDESPFNTCRYEDPNWDECIYCGQPYERK